VKREAAEFFLVLTGRILMAFSAFAPKWEPAKMGTAWRGRLFRLFDSLPLDKFSPTSEIFFSFLPLPTDYCILPTASSPSALILQPKRPSYRHRNALHSATETPFILQPKRTFFFCKNAPRETGLADYYFYAILH
jgi:hypothetical protein